MLFGRQRGIKDDSTLVAYECVEDVVRTLCEGARLGKISAIGGGSGGFVFDVAERVDKTANQTERNRVVFSLE